MQETWVKHGSTVPSASDLPWPPGKSKCSGDINGLGLAGVIVNAEADVRELAHVEVQASEGVLLAVNAIPVPARGTAGVELIGAAESATTAEPEALEAWAGDKAGRGPCMVP
jgi:hypothetical protein